MVDAHPRTRIHVDPDVRRAFSLGQSSFYHLRRRVCRRLPELSMTVVRAPGTRPDNEERLGIS